jgi:hypothetical protein
MSDRNARRSLAVLIVAAALALPLSPPAAAAIGAPSGGTQAVGLWEQAWGWLVSLWGEEGGCVDPDGRCGEVLRTGKTGPTPNAGSCVDPNGGSCQAVTVVRIFSEEGGCVDPDGRCGH